MESTTRQLSPAETSNCFKSSVFRRQEEEQPKVQKPDTEHQNHKAEIDLFAPAGTAYLKSANGRLSASTDHTLAPAVDFAQPQRQKSQARGERWQPFEYCIMPALAWNVGNVDIQSESITYRNELITCRYAIPARFFDHCAGRQLSDNFSKNRLETRRSNFVHDLARIDGSMLFGRAIRGVNERHRGKILPS